MPYYNYDTGAFRGYCVLCGVGGPKRDFDRIMIRNGRYGSPKQMAYTCRECSSKVADFLGVELPDVDHTESRKPYQYSRYCPACQRREDGDGT